MDEYTKNTKNWLDEKFKSTDKNGIYKSHAPIYGFPRDLLSLGLYKNNYTIIKEIEKVSSEYKIENFLEVGCAEGYTTHLVKEIFNFKCSVCDLSTEAVKRAREIYGCDGFVCDVQQLSNIKDNCFDLVLCSETIEHVPNPIKAFNELKRITKKVLIITVPAAKNQKEKKEYIPPKGPHTHLTIFTKEEIKTLTNESEVKGISINWLTKIGTPFTADDGRYIFGNAKYLSMINKILNVLFIPFRNIYCTFVAKIFIKLDYNLNKYISSKVFTYMATYKKRSPDLISNKHLKKGILNYILEGSKVEPYFLDI